MIASPVQLPLAAGPIPPPRRQVDYYGKALRWRWVIGGLVQEAALVSITDNGGQEVAYWSRLRGGAVKMPPWVLGEGRPA